MRWSRLPPAESDTYDEQRFAEPYLKAAELDESISLARKGRARRRAERVGTSHVWSNVT